MKLQMRFSLVLAVLIGVMSTVLFVQYILDANRTQIILDNELAQRKAYVSQIIGLDGQSLASLAKDYSFWDEMVDFTRTRNPSFANNNIDTSIAIYDVDGAWVYNSAGQRVYDAASSEGDKLSLRALTLTEVDRQMIDQKKSVRYFTEHKDRIVEVRAVTIVPGNDPDHKTPAQGYWVVARILNEDYIQNIQSLTGQKIAIIGQDAKASDRATADLIQFFLPLSDKAGKTTHYIRAQSQVAYIESLSSQYSRDLLVFGLTGVLIILVMLLALRRFVIVPVNAITASIYRQQPETLLRLTKSKTEFGDLAKTMMTFFEQKARIAKEEYEKEELERLNKEKGAFLSLAAHELASPIAKIRTFTEFLGMTLEQQGKKDDTINLQISRIGHQMKRVGMLIDDLRSASQGRSDLSMAVQPFHFDKLVREEVAQAAFATDHTLTFEGGVDREVVSDPERIGQLLSNLIRNAVKYSPEAHEVIISTKDLGEKVEISVKDFGIGISENDQVHLFEKYFRAPSVKDGFKGLGLGLSVVKQIAEKLGGEVRVESKVGEGSTFIVQLAARASQAKGDPKEEAHL
jgi:signal transduction histidine kinase